MKKSMHVQSIQDKLRPLVALIFIFPELKPFLFSFLFSKISIKCFVFADWEVNIFAENSLSILSLPTNGINAWILATIISHGPHDAILRMLDSVHLWIT